MSVNRPGALAKHAERSVQPEDTAEDFQLACHRDDLRRQGDVVTAKRLWPTRTIPVFEDAIQRGGNDRRQFQQLSDDARHLAMDGRDLGNSVRQQLGGNQNLHPLHLERQHGCTTLNVIADGLGNLGRVGGASRPSKQGDMHDVAARRFVQPKTAGELAGQHRHPGGMVDRLAHAEVAHEGQSVQGIDQIDLVVLERE